MKHGRIRLETTGNVAVMTLNDPSVLNAFGQKLREDMTAAMDLVDASYSALPGDHRRWTGILFRRQSERSRPTATRPRRRSARRSQRRSGILV